jgi:hypothetical protein
MWISASSWAAAGITADVQPFSQEPDFSPSNIKWINGAPSLTFKQRGNLDTPKDGQASIYR